MFSISVLYFILLYTHRDISTQINPKSLLLEKKPTICFSNSLLLCKWSYALQHQQKWLAERNYQHFQFFLRHKLGELLQPCPPECSWEPSGTAPAYKWHRWYYPLQIGRQPSCSRRSPSSFGWNFHRPLRAHRPAKKLYNSGPYWWTLKCLFRLLPLPLKSKEKNESTVNSD